MIGAAHALNDTSSGTVPVSAVININLDCASGIERPMSDRPLM